MSYKSWNYGMTTFLGPQVSGAESIAPDGETEILIIELIDAPISSIGITETFVERSYALITFSTFEAYNAHFTASPLVYQSEGIAASADAYDEWQTVINLMTSGASKSAVDAQVGILNTEANRAWGYAGSAYTSRFNAKPLHTWLNLSLIRTENPILYSNFFGTSAVYWKWLKTQIRLSVRFHTSVGESFLQQYLFETSPNKLPILKDTFLSSTQTMFGGNHKIYCISNFSGSGSNDCATQSANLMALSAAGLKFNVTVEYITSEVTRLS